MRSNKKFEKYIHSIKISGISEIASPVTIVRVVAEKTLQRLAIDCGTTCGDFSFVEMTKMRANTGKN